MKFYSAKITLLLIIYGSLSSILAEIDNANFLQVHRSYIVNSNKVTTTTFKTLTMRNNEIIPVRRKYRILLDSFFK